MLNKNFQKATMFLFSILHNNCFINSCVFVEDLLTCIISRPPSPQHIHISQVRGSVML
jgi:hypothetical protein